MVAPSTTFAGALGAALSWHACSLAAPAEPQARATFADVTPTPAEETRKKPAPAEEVPEKKVGHFLKFGLRIALVPAFRLTVRYADSPPCSGVPTPDWNGQQGVCGHVPPLALETGLSIGATDTLEPYAFVRLGFTQDDNTGSAAPVMGGIGARVYSSSSALKFFVEPALALALEGFGSDPAFENYLNPNSTSRAEALNAYTPDLLLHMACGPQYDFARHFGAFASVGLDVSLVRALGLNLAGSLGLQGRFP